MRSIAKDVEPATLKAFQMHVVEGVPDNEGGSLEELVKCWSDLPADARRSILAIAREFSSGM